MCVSVWAGSWARDGKKEREKAWQANRSLLGVWLTVWITYSSVCFAIKIKGCRNTASPFEQSPPDRHKNTRKEQTFTINTQLFASVATCSLNIFIKTLHTHTHGSKRAHIGRPRDQKSVCRRGSEPPLLIHVIFSSSFSIIHFLRQARKGEPCGCFSVSVINTLCQMYLSCGTPYFHCL